MNDLTPRVVLVAITKGGADQIVTIGPELPASDVVVLDKFRERLSDLPNKIVSCAMPVKDHIGMLFENYDQIVFFVALGGVVRLIAPHLKTKETDPGIIVIDNKAQFVIPVLSGHVGGANAYAQKLADLLGATPVMTTAADVGNTLSVDILGRELSWRVEAPKLNITRSCANMVNEEPIAFIQEAGTNNWWNRPQPLPKNIHLFDRFEDVDLDNYRSILWVTHRDVPKEIWDQLHERLVVYRPPSDQGLTQK